MSPGLGPAVPDNDEIVMTLVEMALSRPPAEREAYLREACGADLDLFRQTWAYVQAEEEMGAFLAEPLIHPPKEDDERLRPGDLLAGRFRILREVGEGGMGLVYEAHDAKLERRVAVKWPRFDFRKRVPPEVRHARQISHPNVCRIFDIHTVVHAGHEVDFLTMEFLDGETLAARIKRGPVPLAEAEKIALDLCSGLSEAHRNQVVHGDLKSNNVILAKRTDGSTRAVITDFGLARRPETNQPVSTARGGTPDYMAPELWRGDEPARASDIYALGVILYELIAGERPFTSALPFDARPFKPTRVDARWDHVLAKCLEADPANRTLSADDLSAELRAHSRRRFMAGMVATAAGVTALWTWAAGRGGWQPKTSSIALIPFQNAAGAAETEYLSDGISDSLTSALSRVPDLKVVARTSSARFKGKSPDLRAASRALGVRALVTGSVSEVHGSVRISVELVNGADGTQIWGSRYETTIAGLRQVEAAIVREVSRRAGSTMSDADWTRLAAAMRIKPEAYGLLLQGRYHMQLYTPESRQKAVELYQQALAVDPGSALAHAELARGYRLLGGSAVVDPAEVLPRAEAASRRALAIDNDCADAHAALADIRKDQWDWPGAEFEYRRAIELSPNLANAHQGFAIFCSIMDRFSSAERAIQRALELDPLGLPTAVHKAAVSYNARRFSDALHTLRRASESDPSATSPWAWSGMAHAALGDFPAAISAYEKAMKLGDNTAATQCYYAFALAAAGDRVRPLEIIRRIQRGNGYVPRCALAVAFAGLNQKERAIQVLREAFAAKDAFLQYLNVDAHYDSLRADSRFQDIRARIGLPRVNMA